MKLKSLILVLTISLALILPLYSQEESDLTRSITLDNGLRIFLYEKHTLPLVSCVFGVNVGSKDETEETNGLVHILEHYILFRGTKQQNGQAVNQGMRSRGAYFNARTGRDISLFEITIPSQHIDYALKNLKDILFNLNFNQDALDEEKQIILEELSHILDDPVRRATSLLYQNLFPNHPYEQPIYGKKEVIEAATIEQLTQFWQKFFVPANCSLAVVGDFSIAEVEPKIKTFFGDLQNKDFTEPEYPQAATLKRKVEIEEEMDVNVAYLGIAFTAPDYNHKDQYGVDVLTEIYARGVSPMIFTPLSRKRIQVNSVRMGFSSHKFGGAIVITLALEPKHLKRARREIINYLKQSRKYIYTSDDVIASQEIYVMDFLIGAKNRIRFRSEQSQERGLAIATSLARHILVNEIEDRGNYLSHIEEIDGSDIREMAGRYLGQKGYVVVSIQPKDNDKD